MTSGIDLALHLVARELGTEAAQAAADEIEHRWDREAITTATV